MNLDVGPVLRTLRRHPGVLALVVLEIAAGVTTISSLLISGAWYGHVGDAASGLDEPGLILISTYSPTTPAAGGSSEGAERADLLRRDADRQRIRAVAGVQAVSQVSSTIFEDRWSLPHLFRSVPAAGPPREAVGWGVYADVEVSRALALRFLAGRPPLPIDATSTKGPSAAIITRCLAERLFGAAASAVGARLASQLAGPTIIAGVVEDVAMRNPFVPQVRCVAFLLGGAPNDRETRWIARVQPGERAAVIDRLRASFAPERQRRFVQVSSFDSAGGVHHRIGRGLIGLMEFFGGLVGVVALVGALAATSFLVAQRTRQIGIRRALGATKADIVSFFLVESTLAVFVGSLLGVAGSLAMFLVMRRVFVSLRFGGDAAGDVDRQHRGNAVPGPARRTRPPQRGQSEPVT